MFIDYDPALLESLADLHSGYADPAYGLYPFPAERWESIFTRPEIDPRRDVIIAARPGSPDISSPAAFSWLYPKPAPSHVYLRGPFLSPDDPDISCLLDLVIEEAVGRAVEYKAGYVESRALYPAWKEAFSRAGFSRMGAYERWRLFPLKGSVAIHSLPPGGAIRTWNGMSDIPILMGLFADAFGDHWDYIPPKREDWEEVAKGRGFEPGLVLVAMDGGSPAGYIFGERMPDYSAPTLECAYLVSIGLAEARRRKGWGRALLSRWLRAVYDAGPRSVELDVDENNEAAKALYARFRFKRLRTEEVWRRYLRDDG